MQSELKAKYMLSVSLIKRKTSLAKISVKFDDFAEPQRLPARKTVVVAVVVVVVVVVVVIVVVVVVVIVVVVVVVAVSHALYISLRRQASAL